MYISYSIINVILDSDIHANLYTLYIINSYGVATHMPNYFHSNGNKEADKEWVKQSEQNTQWI